MCYNFLLVENIGAYILKMKIFSFCSELFLSILSLKIQHKHMFVFIFSLFLVLKNNILLLEFSFPFVRPSVPIFDILSMGGAAAASAGADRGTIWLDASWIHVSWRHASWTHLRGSHGLSARRAQRTKSSRPEGPQARSWGPTGR